MSRRLLIKVTSGADEPERLSQALTISATAIASGVEVSLWLTGEASWLAVPGRVPELGLEHAVPLSELVEAVLAGGSITLCSQCAVRRGITPEAVWPGVRIAGAATFVAEAIADDVQALIY